MDAGTSGQIEQAHHEMGPSTLARRAACPGSLRLERGQPDAPSEYAEEGTDLHAMLQRLLAGTADEGEIEVLEPDQREAVRWCLEQYSQLDADMGDDAEIHFEKRLSLEWIDCGFGTADVVIVAPFDRAIILDWKFGWGDVEEARGNKQLAAYALAVAHEWDVPEVTVVVAQAAPKRRTIYTYDADALAKIEKAVVEIKRRCEAPDAPVIAGPHCKYCRAKLVCPALAEISGELATTSYASELTGDKLASLLHKIQLVEPVIAAAKARAYEILTAGGEIPGWHLVEGRKTRAWVDDPELADWLEAAAAGLGKEAGDIYERKIASPAQLEKAWGRSKPVREALASLITEKAGKPKLEAVKE